MTVDYWDEPEFDPDGMEAEELSQRDSVVDDAKEELEGFFGANNQTVFYQRQLQVIFEEKFFHWITAHALQELVEERAISSEEWALAGTGNITIYRARGYRYWRREARELVELVRRFSEPAFTAAFGAQGELMFDAALPNVGFVPNGREVRSYGGKTWTESAHDLDRIFVRDGIAYEAEIKNTLGYIGRDELAVKLRMCRYLDVRPLFILRMAPKSYINRVREEGGFTLIFKYQLYPFGHKAFADEVKTKLRLFTDSPARIADGTMQRFLKWHMRTLAGAAGD